MSKNIKSLVQQMTLLEKASLCSGKSFWHLNGVERLDIPSTIVADGPHGLRFQDENAGNADHLGISKSEPAVCFPAACATASSYDRELLNELGGALADACHEKNVSIILGPGVNIKRSPLCGRNFEYFSEDPFLAGELSSAQIKGTQDKNIGTSIKHFAANNQEYNRLITSSDMDERTLREIYLTAFEIAVKKVKPWTVMCSYNRINGVHASDNKKLLTDILRDEWGFEGYVVSDWGGVNNRVAALKAGLDLEMPTSRGVGENEIVEAVKEGNLEEQVLDKAVERILRIVFKYVSTHTASTCNMEDQHSLATQMASKSAVLLKNNNILPLNATQKIAFIGEYAEKPRFQGGGSSHVNTYKTVSALQASESYDNITYERGFVSDKDEENTLIEEKAIALARNSDVAVVFAGLPEAFESEGLDRKHMRLPECQNKLIEQICAVQPNTVVVLHNGSPVEMPWADKVSAILEMYLGGQGVGQASIDLLFGKANPCGKLAETFPIKLEDNPSYLEFHGNGKNVNYSEGVYVGYRWYDSRKMEVLFPFGHGLSYTQFEYSNMRCSNTEMEDTDTMTVSIDVKNIGKCSGDEIIQLYISDKTESIRRPDKELKGFEKIHLNVGESKTVEFTLNKRSFAWYNVDISDWYCASGNYEIIIGASSRDIRATSQVKIKSSTWLPFVITELTSGADILSDPRTAPLLIAVATEVLVKMKKIFGENKANDLGASSIESFSQRFLRSTPMRGFYNHGMLNKEQMQALLRQLNEVAGGKRQG